ncbi:hypothetical protein Tco_0993749 [Tanacetum coccineum]
MPKYSATPFDQAALDEYDLKDKLFKLIRESMSYDKHLAYKALYDALMQSLIIDENDIDKQLEDLPTQKKTRRDDQDQDPPADLEKEKKKRKQKNSKSSKKDKDQAGSFKKGKSPSKSSKTDKSVHADKTVHDVEMEAGEPVENDVVDAEDPTQADASAPKQDKSTWFKMVVVDRPESPDPEWHKEPTIDDAHEQTWFNEMVNAEKNQRTFDDVMDLVIDFTNFTKNCLKKDKITKADLEGPKIKLMKGIHKNYIEVEYNFEQCYLALSDQLDWVNPEGDRILHDFSKPLPLYGAPGHLTIPVDFFFNKDLKYLTTGNVEKKYDTSLTKLKAVRYDLE